MASEAIEKLIQQIKNEAASDMMRHPEVYAITMFGMPIGHIAALRAFFEKHTGIPTHKIPEHTPEEIVNSPVRR